MDPVTAVSTALSVIAQVIADARAANDAAAVEALEALIADSAIGGCLVARAIRAQVVLDAGRARVVAELQSRDTPVLGVPALDSLAAMAARENG